MKHHLVPSFRLMLNSPLNMALKDFNIKYFIRRGFGDLHLPSNTGTGWSGCSLCSWALLMAMVTHMKMKVLAKPSDGCTKAHRAHVHGTRVS